MILLGFYKITRVKQYEIIDSNIKNRFNMSKSNAKLHHSAMADCNKNNNNKIIILLVIVLLCLV